MARAKEGAHAFMPTSNDSLNAPASTNNTESKSSSRNSFSSSLSRRELETTVLSPPSFNGPSDGLVSPTDMSLPNRQQVPSASPLPASETNPPTDQVFWHNQYRRVIGIHENERKLWNDEKQYLERRIASLANELCKKRNDSGVSYFSGKENDKVFADPEVVKQSQEKLRQFSNASPHEKLRHFSATSSSSEQASVGSLPATRTASEVKSSDDAVEWRQTSFSAPGSKLPTSAAGKRLPSITEDDSGAPPPRRVSINETNTTIVEGPSVQQQLDEDPLAPPTTAKLETPPNARTDAGRTPPVPRVPVDTNVEEGSPSPTATGGQIPGFGGQIPVFDDPEDDPSLHSPKMLPSAPKSGHSDELDAFSQRLEEVAANPEDNIPEAVRRSNASLASPLPLVPPAPIEGQDQEDTGGIRLKTKRSMNFGAPLGNLRKS